MKIAPIPEEEDKRLENLASYQILDTDFDADYDGLTKLASFICQTPIALISLVDSERQWFKSKVGLEVNETPRNYAFCAHAILNKDDVLVIKDTLKDERFIDNPLVTGNPNIRFYAGAPLISREGYALGTICAIDKIPRELTEDQLNALRSLSKHVIKLLELNKSFIQIKDYSRELLQLNSSKDKLFSIISHDIKSPFISILGFSEMLNTDIDSLSKEEVKDISEKIYSTSKNTYKFIENLLHWSLFERGKMEAHPEIINLNELIMKVNSLLSGSAEQKKILLLCNGSEDLLVYADSNMIFSLFQNLIPNAIKFTPAGGAVTTSFYSFNEFVEIKIADNGIGIEKQKLKNIFDVKAADSIKGTEGEEGTGLGLALCRHFVNYNHGQISVESERGKGTIFSVRLPKTNNSNL